MLMRLGASDLFQVMTDEDFVEVYEMGDLERFCNAVTIDLQTKNEIINEV